LDRLLLEWCCWSLSYRLEWGGRVPVGPVDAPPAVHVIIPASLPGEAQIAVRQLPVNGFQDADCNLGVSQFLTVDGVSEPRLLEGVHLSCAASPSESHQSATSSQISQKSNPKFWLSSIKLFSITFAGNPLQSGFLHENSC
jgi:hypothetical protein